MTNETEKTPSSQAPSTKPKSGSKMPLLALGIVLALVVVGVIFYFLNKDKVEVMDNGNPTTATTSPAAVDPTTPLANVAGETITVNDVNLRTQVLVNNNQSAGVELSEDELLDAQRIALQQLVNETLILQAAQSDDVTVDQADIDQEYGLAVANFPDEQAFQDALAQSGLTEADVRQDITRQLTIQKYVDLNTNIDKIEVTDEEVDQLYNDYASKQENMPAQEEIQDQLEQQIYQQKYNVEIDTLIKALQAAADIQYFN